MVEWTTGMVNILFVYLDGWARQDYQQKARCLGIIVAVALSLVRCKLMVLIL